MVDLRAESDGQHVLRRVEPDSDGRFLTDKSIHYPRCDTADQHWPWMLKQHRRCQEGNKCYRTVDVRKGDSEERCVA